MKTIQVEFSGSLGDTLSARLDEPEGDARAFAIFAHCFTCSKDLPVVRRISKVLTGHGMAILRFDFSGLGQSEGNFEDSNFSTNVADLLCAADWLSEHYQPPQLMVGHSLGGAAVLAAAGEIDSVRAVATIAAPAEPNHITHMFADKVDEARNVGQTAVEIAGRTFEISKQFVEDVEQYSLLEKVAVLRRALLIFHSPQDVVVDVENAASIYKAAKHPKSFVSIDGADHMLSKRKDAEFVAGVLGTWALRYANSTPL